MDILCYYNSSRLIWIAHTQYNVMSGTVMHRIWSRLSDRYQKNSGCECGDSIEEKQSEEETKGIDRGCE